MKVELDPKVHMEKEMQNSAKFPEQPTSLTIPDTAACAKLPLRSPLKHTSVGQK